jgi:hypothetical protein
MILYQTYAKLKKERILTEEEFQEMKQDLISNNG